MMDTEPALVAVAGSCLTRDNFNSRFNPDYKRWFTCEVAANQTSMIAMMSPPILEPWQPRKEFNEYDAWNITNDLERGFLTDVVEKQPAYLILDFFADIHFGVIKVPDGRYFTDNRWKHHHTSLYDDFSAQGELERLTPYASEGFFELWCDALDRFATHIATKCPNTVVIVHRGFNARRAITPEHPETVPLLSLKKLAALDPSANEWWDRLDDYAIATHGWDSIDLRDGRYPSSSEHPWGAFYVHYSLDYFPQFLAELNRIHMSRAEVSDTAARLSHMEAARRGEVARLAATARGWQAATRRARRRVRELESLGVVRAARFAIGQRLRRRRRK